MAIYDSLLGGYGDDQSSTDDSEILPQTPSSSGFGEWMGHDLGSFLGLTPEAIASQLGLPEDAASSFYSIDPAILQALNPNDPMYGQRITGTQQSFMPSLMQSALSLGSGQSGGLGRSSRHKGEREQQMFQPYLSQLGATMSGISSDVGAAKGMAGDYLSGLMDAYQGLDFSSGDGGAGDSGDGFDWLSFGQEFGLTNIKQIWDDLGHNWDDMMGYIRDFVGGESGIWDEIVSYVSDWWTPDLPSPDVTDPMDETTPGGQGGGSGPDLGGGADPSEWGGVGGDVWYGHAEQVQGLWDVQNSSPPNYGDQIAYGNDSWTYTDQGWIRDVNVSGFN